MGDKEKVSKEKIFYDELENIRSQFADLHIRKHELETESEEIMDEISRIETQIKEANMDINNIHGVRELRNRINLYDEELYSLLGESKEIKDRYKSVVEQGEEEFSGPLPV